MSVLKEEQWHVILMQIATILMAAIDVPVALDSKVTEEHAHVSTNLTC